MVCDVVISIVFLKSIVAIMGFIVLSSGSDSVISLVIGLATLVRIAIAVDGSSHCRIRANRFYGRRFAKFGEKRRIMSMPNDRVECLCATMLLQDVTG